MKKLLLCIAILMAVTAINSCTEANRLDASCTDVSFHTFFTIEGDHVYCFPNGDYLKIFELVNAYCPCFTLCDSEGEMEVQYEAQIDNTIYKGKVGSLKWLSHKIEDEWILEFDNIKFVTPCTDVNTNPEIKSTDIRVKKI